MINSHFAFALFSGGLDSLLSIKLIEAQGISVIPLHFITPFFGFPKKIDFWKETYNIDVRCIDISEEYISMLKNQPAHGFGKNLNPCIDCKILMLKHAYKLMEQEGACCVISGEVLGQRPMSQRREALEIITKESLTSQNLLRPLCAKRMEPTFAEEQGIIDRSRLLSIHGRGRKQQLKLAKEFGISIIPTPAGGCRLTEPALVNNYWSLFKRLAEPTAKDFCFANCGRQFWHNDENNYYWLIMGRNKEDNDQILELADKEDIIFKIKDNPGPLAVARYKGLPWNNLLVDMAIKQMLRYSKKVVEQAKISDSSIFVSKISNNTEQFVYEIKSSELELSSPSTFWSEYSWDNTHKIFESNNSEQHHII